MNSLSFNIWIRAVALFLVALWVFGLFMQPTAFRHPDEMALVAFISFVAVMISGIPALLFFSCLFPFACSWAGNKPQAMLFASLLACAAAFFSSVVLMLLPFAAIDIGGNDTIAFIVTVTLAGTLPAIISILTCHKQFNSFYPTNNKNN